ncbi:MAG: hypothetical protein KHX03_08260 [Clostridium sp.]|nr:hypothetical protein [Clostridium sp.]
MKLKVLILQNNAIIGNKQATIENAYKLLAPFKNETPDLIIFPEVWSIGWYCKNFPQESEIIETSETIDFLKNTALDFKSTVIGGSFIQKKENTFKNTCPVINKEGKLIATYDKMHLFSHKGSEENKYISTGNELKILNLGFTKIGLTICYDIRFPEIYRQYSKHGVEIFVNAAAWSNKKLEHWNIMHRSRAIENQCFMITADQTGKITDDEYNLGHSMLINPWGDIDACMGEEEGCIITEFDTDDVKNLRKEFPLISDRRDLSFDSFKIKEIKLYE